MSSSEPPVCGEMATRLRCRRRWRLLLACVLILGSEIAMAHEGHEPLPTKGVLVDVAAGTIALSRVAQQALGVATAEVATRPFADRTLAYARLIPGWNRHAFAAAGIGGRVVAIHVRAGDSVQAGQRLATLQSVALETIQLELLAARAEHDLATRNLDRLTSLVDAQVATGRELTEARARWQQMAAASQVAQAKLLGLGLPADVVTGIAKGSRPPLGSLLEIASPIGGTVMHVEAMNGDLVQGNEHLFEIVDLAEVLAEVQVLERDVQRVSVGQPMEVVLSAYPAQPIETSVQTVGLMLAPDTKLATAWATVVNSPAVPARYLPGMTGQAQLLGPPRPDRIAVPAEALITNGLEKFVLVEEAATREGFEYRKQNVIIAGSGLGMVGLRDGNVFPGDQVVTTGSHELGGFFIAGSLRLSPEAEVNMSLRTEPAGLHAIDEILEFDGLVDVPPGSRFMANALVEGRITRIACRNGQSVSGRELIAEITSLEVLDLQLELIQAAAERRMQEESLARLRVLDTTQSVPQRRVWETQTAAMTAAERVDSLSRTLQRVGFSADEVEAMATAGRVFPTVQLRAPGSGTIVRLDAVLGQVVQPHQVVAEIHDPRHVWVRGHLAEPEVGRLPAAEAAVAVRVRFTSLPEAMFVGRLVRRGVAVDLVDRTLPVWVEIDVPAGTLLQHNMLARVTLPVAQTLPTLAVPATAIVRQGTRSYVFIQAADGSFRRQPVEVGRHDDHLVAVTQGLMPGEIVAVAGVADLQTAFASIR